MHAFALATSSIGGVDFRSRRWMPGSSAEQDVRAEHAVGIGEPLDPPHELGRLRAPLALHVRRHVAAGAVLGLQRAVVLVHHELHQLLHEGLVAVAVGGVGERRRQQEVQVAGGRVAGDAGEELVLAEQRLDVARGLRDAVGANADVLDDQRRALRAHRADDALHALAHAPEDLGLVRVAGEGGGLEQLAALERGERALLQAVELGRVVGAQLDEQHRALGRQLAPALRDPGQRVGRRDQRRVDHQLDRRRARLDQRRHRRRGGVDVGKNSSPVACGARAAPSRARPRR